MMTMNRVPWLWYAWALLTAYGLMTDRRWLLAAAIVAVVGIVRSRAGAAAAQRDLG